MKSIHKIVVKVGTSTLTQGTKKLSRRYMLDLCRQIAALHEAGKQVILVSSGAIAAGREYTHHPTVERSLPAKQMFASIGQVQLMQCYSELFSIYEIDVAQVLLTRDDISNRKRYLNIRDTLSCLHTHGVIPIINENDTVATKEIRVGDNDNLSALVANLVAADLLILLTDQEGLYTADPRHHKEAKFIPVVDEITEEIMNLARGSSTKLGTGGMVTKIEAAKVAATAGTPTIIASSARENVLIDIVAGKEIGTRFTTHTTPRESRKRWLLTERKQGEIVVDAGAAHKLSESGASLLASGITKVVDSFDRGAIVHIVGTAGKAVAVGITNYSSEDITKLLGSHSKEIEEILGYSYGSEIIHRNNMAPL